jgi:signal transduction histidine kinase
VLLSGVGLLALGALSLADALGEAEARAQRDARRAAEATAQDLRRALRSPEALAAAPADARFAIRDGAVVEPEACRALPELGDPRDALPIFVRASLEDLDLEAGARDRVEAAAEGLQDPLRTWLELRLAWHLQRNGEAAARDALLGRIDARAAAGADPLGANVAAAILLAAAAGRPPPAWALTAAPRLGGAEVLGLAGRLRELGRGAEAEALETAHAEVAARRALLDRARRALRRADQGLAAVDGALVLVGAEGGAVVEPAGLVAALRARGALVVPWSGELQFGAQAGAVQVVPGLLAIGPERPRVDRSGTLGFGLVLLACGAVFAFGLGAARRALRRETEALRTRAAFLTSVTHELKTPLASLRLLAERLSEGRVRGADKQREYFALLAGESARLTVLIENVLDLGRMERGERSYDRRPQQLDAVLKDAVAVVRPLAQADGLELRVAPGAPGATGEVDRGALVQLLVNVLDNARRYARAGGRIEVATRCDAGAWEGAVRDFGPGVPEAERERIFERFVRGAAQADGSVPGVGLGLHLAREIARAHGGELRCEAAPEGPGAVFRLTLPAGTGGSAAEERR